MALRYSVGVAGLAPQEQKLLEFTLGVSQRRDVQYEIANRSSRPDLLIIESSELDNLRRVYMAHLQHRIPIIIVGDEHPTYSGERIARPIRWMKLFDVLDAQVAKTAKNAGLAISQEDAAVSVAKLVEADTQVHTGNTVIDASQAVSPTVADFVRRHHVEAPARDCVLVVDDSPPVREFMKSRLASFNVDVDFAESGEQAVACVEKRRYIAVFLDVVLPGADGYQVCRTIRSAKAAFQPVVIMLTSKDSAFDKIRGRMAGCTSYLTKPVNDELLFETMHKFLPQPAPDSTTSRVARAMNA
jgi:twitching motility two-component system response regulator PilG